MSSMVNGGAGAYAGGVSNGASARPSRSMRIGKLSLWNKDGAGLVGAAAVVAAPEVIVETSFGNEFALSGTYREERQGDLVKSQRITLSNGTSIPGLPFYSVPTEDDIEASMTDHSAVFCQDSGELLLYGKDVTINFASGVSVTGDCEGFDYHTMFHSDPFSSEGLNSLSVTLKDGTLIVLDDTSVHSPLLYKEIDDVSSLDLTDMTCPAVFFDKQTQGISLEWDLCITTPESNMIYGDFEQNFCSDSNVFFESSPWIYDGAITLRCNAEGLHFELPKTGVLTNDEEKYNGSFSYNSNTGSCYPHGRGKLFHSEALLYEGDFFQGKRHGKGRSVYYHEERRSVYRGSFKDGVKHGMGSLAFGPRKFCAFFQKDRLSFLRQQFRSTAEAIMLRHKLRSDKKPPPVGCGSPLSKMPLSARESTGPEPPSKRRKFNPASSSGPATVAAAQSEG